MLTPMLANPFLTSAQKIRDAKIWEKLELWDRLREQYPGLGPDPHDRAGQGFRRG